MQDLHNTIYPIATIPSTVVSDNTAQVGTIIDLAAVLTGAGDDTGGYDGLEYIINIGTISDGAAVFTPLVEDSDDGITFTAVVDQFLLGTELEASFNDDDDNLCKRIGYIGSKRYVRITVTPATNADDAEFGVIAVPCFARSVATPNN